MTRSQRNELAAKIDKYEAPLIAAAKREGRLPVVDCTAKQYPVKPAQLAELNRLLDPTYREQANREAAALRRKARSLRSLADGVLDRDGKATQADAQRTKAAEYEAEADRLEESVAP